MDYIKIVLVGKDGNERRVAMPKDRLVLVRALPEENYGPTQENMERGIEVSVIIAGLQDLGVVKNGWFSKPDIYCTLPEAWGWIRGSETT